MGVMWEVKVIELMLAVEFFLQVEFALALVLAGMIAVAFRVFRKKNKRSGSNDEDAHWI